MARPCYADRADISKLKERYPSLVSVDFSSFERLESSHVKKMKEYHLHMEDLHFGPLAGQFDDDVVKRGKFQPRIKDEVHFRKSSKMPWP